MDEQTVRAIEQKIIEQPGSRPCCGNPDCGNKSCVCIGENPENLCWPCYWRKRDPKGDHGGGNGCIFDRPRKEPLRIDEVTL